MKLWWQLAVPAAELVSMLDTVALVIEYGMKDILQPLQQAESSCNVLCQ